MSQQYDPRRVLRQTSNDLLVQFFKKCKIAVDVDWGRIKETQVEPVFLAWQGLADEDRRQVETVLQDIHALATEDGVRVLIQDGDTWRKDLRLELNKLQNSHDKAMWTFLHHEAIWQTALKFARADSLEGSRPWVKRADVSKKPPRSDPEAIKQLEVAIGSFFQLTQGRGHVCRIQHILRNNRQDYFFVNLSNYADTYDKLDPKRRDFIREAEQRAFSVVIVYEQEAGSLDVYAKGGRKVVKALQEIFARIILSVELEDDCHVVPPYNLAMLLNRDFAFPVEAGDGINHVRLRRMRLSIKGNSKRRITLEANPDAEREDIYDMIDDCLNRESLPAAILDVDQATLCFHRSEVHRGRAATFSVTISRPESSTLKNLREENRELGEKYLKRWKIDVA